MNEEEDNDECCACDCCSKRPISFLIVFIIVLDSIGIIMNVLIVIFTHWKYVKLVFFILTFVSYNPFNSCGTSAEIKLSNLAVSHPN
mgnify:CR=1 FL=1